MSILENINNLKNELEYKIENYGIENLSENHIVEISQKLDKLIVEYYIEKSKKE